jgi:hypothetical protein
VVFLTSEGKSFAIIADEFERRGLAAFALGNREIGWQPGAAGTAEPSMAIS